MKNILVKSGVGQLDCFKGQKFPYFEAYTTGEEDLNLLLNTEMKLISLHMPSTVSVEGKDIQLISAMPACRRSFF